MVKERAARESRRRDSTSGTKIVYSQQLAVGQWLLVGSLQLTVCSRRLISGNDDKKSTVVWRLAGLCQNPEINDDFYKIGVSPFQIPNSKYLTLFKIYKTIF